MNQSFFSMRFAPTTAIPSDIVDWVADNCVEFRQIGELTNDEERELLNCLRNLTIIETANKSLSAQLNLWAACSVCESGPHSHRRYHAPSVHLGLRQSLHCTRRRRQPRSRTGRIC